MQSKNIFELEIYTQYNIYLNFDNSQNRKSLLPEDHFNL